ncbi:MAG TPA: response regulator [Thermoanaerobaculia bacterium]|nr:response regulator [Thermoanaerobaculia bacterium]
MRILIIDDEFSVTENLELYLVREFHTVEAWSFVHSAEHLRERLDSFQPQAVILDFGMEPSGVEIYKWVKDWQPSTPVVFYTSYGATPEFRLQMKQAGAQDYEIIPKREVGSDVKQLLDVLWS